jgi:hypothetical protein
VLRLAFLTTSLVLALAGEAAAFNCPNIPVSERIEAADIAFVGRIVAQRPFGREGQRIYRFRVEQPVKGPLGAEVEIRGARLVDIDDTPVPPGLDVGVLAANERGRFVTSSCGLSDPASLLAGADEPRGEWIKLTIGVVIAAAVIAFSALRLRRRRTELPLR